MHPGETLKMTIRRDGADQQLDVTTGIAGVGGHKVGLLGVRGGAVEYRHVSVPAALLGGVTQTWTITRETFTGLAQMISGTRGTEELGGPLRIAQLSGQVAQLGIASLISFIAVLSVNLGLINLFPVPVLDGGHLRVLSGGGPARASTAAARPGIWISSRSGVSGLPVCLRDMERPDPSRAVSLGRQPDRLMSLPAISRGGQRHGRDAAPVINLRMIARRSLGNGGGDVRVRAHRQLPSRGKRSHIVTERAPA